MQRRKQILTEEEKNSIKSNYEWVIRRKWDLNERKKEKKREIESGSKIE